MSKSVLSYEQLAARFESLGEDCEFGIVQRCFGAEPLSLFRFTAVRLRAITDAISTAGSRLFTEQDLNLYYFESLDEYLIVSWHYQDFHTHTFLGRKDGELDVLRPKRLAVLAYLKKKFFEDMRRSEKIYVRRGADNIVDLRRLHAALNVYAKNTLVCIAEADCDHKAGTVEKIGEGIWRGYLQRFKDFNRNTPLDLVNWTSVLERVQEACDKGSKIERRRRLASGPTLTPNPHFADKASTVLSRGTFQLRLQRSTGFDKQIIASEQADLVVKRGSVVVFSVWIRVGAGFNGFSIVPSIDLPALHTHAADLTLRDRWQKIWATVALPAGRRTSVLAVEAIASEGSVVTLGGWSVDTGPVPCAPSPAFWRKLKRSAQRTKCRRTDGDTPASIDIDDVMQRSSHAIARGSYVAADDMLSTALASKPDDAALLKQYAFSAHNRGNYQRAIDRWQDALKAAPYDAMCHAGVAANFRESNNFVPAASFIDRALLLFPEDGIVLTEAARIASKQSRFADAVDLWERAIALHGPLAELTRSRDEALARLPRAETSEASP